MYRVKTVCAMTGVPRNTLVAWERRYNLFDSRRTENGYRMYSDEDVDLVRRLKAHVDTGLAISEAVRLLSHEGAFGPTPRRPLWRDLLEPLLAFDRAGADPFLRRAEALPIERGMDEVFRPLLREIGELWAAGRIHVAQEHFASAYIRESLLATFRNLDAGPADGPVAACAGVPGETHDIGLLLVSVRLALRGWRVIWLGPDLPMGDLCAFLVKHPPRLLCLSGVTAQGVAESARQVRACAPTETMVVVGGPATAGLERLSQDQLWFCPEEEDFFRRLASFREPVVAAVH